MRPSATRLIISAAALILGVASGMAQTWDDDIYFDAAKAKKEAVKKEAARKAARAVSVTTYPAADTYVTVTTGSTRDIDEYNRRGIFARPDSSATSRAGASAEGDAFANTRRIERFYNPDVVVENPDGSVAEYYYASEPVDVNIYVNSSYPAYSPYFDPWYSNTWGWGPAWSWGWGPSWSWSWAWGPSWSWSWGWGGPSWGWGPYWGWGGPSWGWGGPAWGWGGPAVTPGFNRPPSFRPGHSSHNNMAGSYRRANAAAAGSYRGGSNYNATTSSGRRASSDSRWNINTVGTAGSNRGESAAGTSAGRRPAGSTYRGTTGTSTGTRGTTIDRSSTSRPNNATTSRSSSGSSSGSWRSSGGSSRSSSSGGGSFRSSGGGGGSRSTGGGGGGGRRR